MDRSIGPGHSAFRVARLFLLVLAAAAALVAIAEIATGGFSFEIGPVLIRGHRPLTAGAVAVISAVLVVLMRARRSDETTLATGGSGRLAQGLAAATAVVVLAAGFGWGDFVAGSADAYGYVSQSMLWANGDLATANPIALESPWPAADWTFSPLGYRPAVVPGVSVPTYPPGLPLVMALAVKAAGPPAAFWIVPLLGALAIWSAFVWARAVVGETPAAITAILLACSPVFLFHLFQPMSDVAVTAWWMTTLALLVRGRFLGAGLCTALALLTRPNLAPLALCVGPWVAYEAWMRSRSRGATAKALLEFGVAPGLAVVFLLALSDRLYGDPLMSGYGAARNLFALAFVPDNLARYPVWLWDTQTPFVYLACAAPLLAWWTRRLRGDPTSETPAVGRLLLSAAFAVTVVCCYLVYSPFEEWWYLRFLLPALPVMLAMAAWVVSQIVGRAPAAWRAPVCALATLVLAAVYLQTAQARLAFDLRDGEQRYVTAGQYASSHLPPRSVFICVQHSGSLRYYGGRLTLRWDWLDPAWLDRAVAHLRRAGYHPYFVLEPPEEDAFRQRFSRSSALGQLDWPAMADLRQNGGVRFYDPAARSAFRNGEPIDSVIVRPNGRIVVRSRSSAGAPVP